MAIYTCIHITYFDRAKGNTTDSYNNLNGQKVATAVTVHAEGMITSTLTRPSFLSCVPPLATFCC